MLRRGRGRNYNKLHLYIKKSSSPTFFFPGKIAIEELAKSKKSFIPRPRSNRAYLTTNNTNIIVWENMKGM